MTNRIIWLICLIQIIHINGINSRNFIQKTYDVQPLFNSDLDHEYIANALKNEDIITIQPMDEYLHIQERNATFTSDVFVITTTSGLKGVFKPNETLCFAEVAAYRISNVLKIHLVPPTVIRKINNQLGSIQLLIEPGSKADLTQINTTIIDTMRIFYFIIGQWDIGNDNQMMQKIDSTTQSLALIDNSAIMDLSHIRYGEFAYVQIGTTKKSASENECTIPFPFDSPTILYKPTKEELITYCTPFLPKNRILALHKRHKKFTFIIWNNQLWLQYYKNDPLAHPNYVENIDSEIIQYFTLINRNLLETCWEEGLKSPYKNKITKLIDLTLARKKMIFEHYYLNAPEKNCA